MKQNITISALNQLSEKGKERLRKWCIEKGYFEYVDTSMPSDLIKTPQTIVKKIIPLSIGQMIEFLGDNDKLHGWLYYFKNGKNAYTLEACDILWEAVKEILEKRKF